MTDDNPTPWMDRQAAAEHLRIHVNTLDEWRKNKGLPYHRVGRVIRFRRHELDEWFAGRDTEEVS